MNWDDATLSSSSGRNSLEELQTFNARFALHLLRSAIRRLQTLLYSSWTLTIGLEDKNSEGGYLYLHMDTKEQSLPCETVGLQSWEAIVNALDSFPRPTLSIDSDGEWNEEMWIFRGLKRDAYNLQPSIEREAGNTKPWAALEYKILHEEFQPKARMHMDPASLPAPEDILSWLAVMQHYGVPTRLLDFTFSPYVALYFAIHGRTPEEQRSSHVALWAIDAKSLKNVAASRSAEAYAKEVEYGVREPRRLPRQTLAHMVASAYSGAEDLVTRMEGDRAIVSEALRPSAVRRNHFERTGFVGFALPSAQNRRLSSQQGAFLFNGTHDVTFEESLCRMMAPSGNAWCKRFRVPCSLLMSIEEKLFQMNIHELSLFPDMQGLAGFIIQKLRLYLVPNTDCSKAES